MKAAIVTRYGSPEVLTVGDLPIPEIPADRMLVRVYAASVNRTDCGELRGHPFFIRVFYGLRRPRRQVFGLDFAGTVEAVGADITRFKPGDSVFGMCPTTGNGSHAEYAVAPERSIAKMPDALSFDDCVVCEGAYYAYGTLKKIGLAPGQSILVYGASGAIGSAMVQLARCFGATVTAVVGTPQLELLESLGADRVIDYTTSDFTQIDDRFDFVVDAVGKTTYFRCRHLLKPGGIFAATDLGPWGQNIVLMLWSSIMRRNRVIVAMPGPASEFIGYLQGCMQQGRFRAVIDRKYALADIVEAYRYVESGRKIGVVLLDLAPSAPG